MKQDKYIDDIIESISAIEKQSVSPFFKSRVLARLANNSSDQTSLVFKPAFVIAFAALLLLVNTLLISYPISNSDNSNQNNVSSTEQQWSDDYSFNNNSSIYFYDDKQ
mgnify:CR=1 FL=1